MHATYPLFATIDLSAATSTLDAGSDNDDTSASEASTSDDEDDLDELSYTQLLAFTEKKKKENALLEAKKLRSEGNKLKRELAETSGGGKAGKGKKVKKE